MGRSASPGRPSEKNAKSFISYNYDGDIGSIKVHGLRGEETQAVSSKNFLVTIPVHIHLRNHSTVQSYIKAEILHMCQNHIDGYRTLPTTPGYAPRMIWYRHRYQRRRESANIKQSARNDAAVRGAASRRQQLPFLSPTPLAELTAGLVAHLILSTPSAHPNALGLESASLSG